MSNIFSIPNKPLTMSLIQKKPVTNAHTHTHTPTIEPFDLRNTKILSYSSHLRNTDKISFDYLTYRQNTPSNHILIPTHTWLAL